MRLVGAMMLGSETSVHAQIVDAARLNHVIITKELLVERCVRRRRCASLLANMLGLKATMSVGIACLAHSSDYRQLGRFGGRVHQCASVQEL